jgi:hypothetical protein
MKSIYGIFVSPRKTMLELPSDRIYPLALLLLIYLNVTRGFRPRSYNVLHDKLGGDLQIVLFMIAISFVTIPIGCWILGSIIALFKKRLTVRKIINISGCAAIPRAIISLAASVAVGLNPELLDHNRTMIITGIIGIATLLYSLFLVIYGIVISPSQDTSQVIPADPRPAESNPVNPV